MSHRTLPYVPFPDFLASLDAIGANPPSHIDASCWSRFPSLNKGGRVLFDTFQYLDLISSDGKVLPALRELLDTGTRAQGLAKTLRAAYSFVIPETLRATTMDRLKRTFRQRAGGDAISRKALSFYLKAAFMAGFELHPLLLPRQRRQRRKDPPPVAPHLVVQPPTEETVLGTLKLEGRGSLTLRLEGQRFSDLTGPELKRATAAALLLKADQQPTGRMPPRADGHARRRRSPTNRVA
jgi:hypothetical protein